MPQRIDREDLAKRICELEGLGNEEKSALLELLNTQKKYGLVWEEKTENVEEALRDNLPVLVEDKNLALTEGGEDAPNHILIEGDNLEALTALTYTHEGLVDVIYIDPPYNTGNKDFVYNDSFVDTEDSYRHSKWLSFMSKRLRIAKRLLSDKGVIFISIDDNEQANLKLLCDEVFGSQNSIATIVWQKIHSIKNDARYLSESHEYALMYAKYKDNFELKLLPRTEEMNARYTNPDNDPRGPWQSGDLVANGERKNGHFIVTSPTTGATFDVPQGKHWVYSQDNLEELISNNSIWFGINGDAFPRKKRFLSEVQAGRTPNTIWLSEEVGHNQTAAKEIINIFGERGKFDFPKPMQYIKQMITISSEENSIVLDFFAGSGTTLHATMQLNAEDRGHRQCILVTNNENNICRDVTYERNKRVIEGYTTPKGQEVEGLKNNNLRYYRTQLLPRDRNQHNMRSLVNASTDLLCIKEGIYREEREIAGLKFKPSVARYFHDGDKRMLVVYNEAAISLVAQHVAECGATAEHPITIYTFSDGAYAYIDEFHAVLPLVDLCALPDAIYQAYRNVLPKRREQADKTMADLSDTEAVKEAMEDNYDYKEGGEA